MIAKFRYHSEKLCIAKFRRDCEIFATIAKFSQSLRNFCYAIAKFQPPALPSTAPGFLYLVPFQLDISSSRLNEIAENSYELNIKHRN